MLVQVHKYLNFHLQRMRQHWRVAPGLFWLEILVKDLVDDIRHVTTGVIHVDVRIGLEADNAVAVGDHAFGDVAV